MGMERLNEILIKCEKKYMEALGSASYLTDIQVARKELIDAILGEGE